jgi:hypothetical protein
MRWQHSATGGVGEGGERPPFVVDDVLGLSGRGGVSHAITAATKLCMPVAETKMVQGHALLVAGFGC